MASRFGADKAVALLDGKPLIEHAVASLRPFCHEVVLCGRAWDGLVSLADLPEPGLGPLGGIAAALAHAEAAGCEAVLTIGCDMPRVPDELLAALVRRPPSYCPDAPILGCWPPALAVSLRRRLETAAACGERSIRRWANDVGALPIPSPEPLANVNTPDDLMAL
jgi:molybdenum cofactor guanylyltransferase